MCRCTGENYFCFHCRCLRKLQPVVLYYVACAVCMWQFTPGFHVSPLWRWFLCRIFIMGPKSKALLHTDAIKAF